MAVADPNPVVDRPDATGRQRAMRPSLLGEPPADLARILADLPEGDRPFRSKQLFHWMHGRGERDFPAMTNLPATLRSSLGERWQVPALHPLREMASSETATRKFVLEASDQSRIETVRIETPRRVTLCISSQVGCGFGCRFCRTAQMGFVRNLTAAEIVDQVLWIGRLAPLPDRFNLVFMGMGEPLANYEQVIRAIDLLGHENGRKIGPRRITVSTVGLVPEIERLAREHPKVRLAVSLNATTDDLRNRLVPVNRRYPLDRLLAAVGEHVRITRRRATFEYVVLAGVNDTSQDARRLARLVNRVPCKLNLIPYNPTGLDGFSRATPESMHRFAEYLYPRTYAVTIRQSQGKDIFAACGQLAQPNRRRKKQKPAAIRSRQVENDG
jgi:23S rRNA (adenine2503-C2)-methyltransferase